MTKTQINGKIPCVLGLKELILRKCSYYYKAFYRFNAIPKIPVIFFTEMEKNDPKIHMEPQKTPIAKTILRKNKAGSITLPDFKVFYKAIV